MPRDRSEIGRNVLITGGAGFIGSNLAARLLQAPDTRITVFDNLSRQGSEHNVRWLESLPGADRLNLHHGDVRDAAQITEAAREATEVYHLAAQVAVTTSIDAPRDDFETNALGTFNVLEAARRSGRRPLVLFTSTNKVYGGLESVPVRADGSRYQALEPGFQGASEGTLLDFHSPYGCSKGAADQYVRDYARIYNLPTVVFRMSCIAGPRQFGNEDQGWVAHFLYSVLAGRPINIYGNGLQVRDILHVADVVDAMEAARAHLSRTAGQVYNVGGGLARAFSIIEMLSEIEKRTGLRCQFSHSQVRPGDQPLYISDTAKLTADTGWQPRRCLPEILADMHEFWIANRERIESPVAKQKSKTSGRPSLAKPLPSPELVAEALA